ncbi:MAG: CocE/NonD family hydrolase [Anaerolineae bacterium]|nr:CocE/NonD family hydrolase [Anaerolineae bacterium]
MSFPSTTPLRRPCYKGYNSQSFYVPMRDGICLAVDLYLPQGLKSGEGLPTLFAATRYWRAQQLKAPFSWFISLPDSARSFFCAYGYALLRIDMRGTGASQGNQPHPWPATDLTDLYDLTDWVIKQPWSNGRVGGFGNSYQATTAEMLGACGHPAVTTALVRFNEYDVYTDIAFPGGVPNRFILNQWAAYNRALDANRVPASLPAMEKWIIKGVKPVNQQPVPSHHNGQVDSILRNVIFRDDYDPELGTTIDDISIHTRPSTHIIDHWGSWFDAATADAVIRRFNNNAHPQRAVIGPWNHGGRQHVGLEKNPFPPLAQMQEVLRFFDAPPNGRELFYYTLFEDAWKSTGEFPLPAFNRTTLFFQPGGGLSGEVLLEPASDSFEVDFSASSGLNNRWQTELDQRPVKYAPIQGALSYTTAPLTADTEITGYPLVSLWIKSDQNDGNFFVYLEALDESGRVYYLTEGMLRALHRKISTNEPPYRQAVPYHSFKRADALELLPAQPAELRFALNPISALLRRGWRLKVSITGADKDTFARIPAQATPRIELLLGGETGSAIEIPTLIRTKAEG